MGHKLQFDLDEVERLASLGLTLDQISAALGISRTTLYQRKADDEDFSDAIKRGQAKGIAKVANLLFENAAAGNVTAQIFFLKARAKWSDRPENDGDDDAPVDSVSVTVVDGRKSDT